MTPGRLLRTIAAPSGYVRGLAWVGRALWCADYITDLIYQVDPSTGRTLRTIADPSGNVRGMIWDGRTLWCVDHLTDLIYQVSVD